MEDFEIENFEVQNDEFQNDQFPNEEIPFEFNQAHQNDEIPLNEFIELDNFIPALEYNEVQILGVEIQNPQISSTDGDLGDHATFLDLDDRSTVIFELGNNNNNNSNFLLEGFHPG